MVSKLIDAFFSRILHRKTDIDNEVVDNTPHPPVKRSPPKPTTKPREIPATLTDVIRQSDEMFESIFKEK